jgi:Icc-related predicted phosphoesterase
MTRILADEEADAHREQWRGSHRLPHRSHSVKSSVFAAPDPLCPASGWSSPAMRILVVSDLHGDLAPVRRAVDRVRPDAILSCGDWGDPSEVSEPELAALVAAFPVATTFGNHDPLDLLARLRDRDGQLVLIGQGAVRTFAGLRVAAIGGIWAKSHRNPWYVTDDDVARFARQIAGDGPVDVLLTHESPVGLADLTPQGRHGGKRSILDAFHTVGPRVHLCGHLHVAQERTLKDGRRVINVGATPEGSVAVLQADGPALVARLERLDAAAL